MILAGIDEAGYGPTLGPLCVGLAALRTEGSEAPDLWKVLDGAVCRKPDKRGRIAVADSKALKLANDSTTRHPLVHLERGVLAFLEAMGTSCGDDATLFDAMGAVLPEHPCYGGGPMVLPVGSTAAQVAIAGNQLRRACGEGGVLVASVRASMVGEAAFNAIVEERGSKAEATLEAIRGHVGTLVQMQRAGGDEVRLVCDRLGGRQSYGRALSTLMSGLGAPAWVDVLEESPECSAYRVRHDHGEMRVEFRVEGESSWLPTALASMAAKLTRELAMARFNRYWGGRMAELKPTAGYAMDARRWLADAAGVLTDEDRRALVRRA
jgi:ribonuclease HII